MTPAAQSRRLASELRRSNTRIVFAESCTAGLIAASLAAVPGISEFLCGSAVVYQEATKQQWLDVSPAMLRRHTAVSQQAAEAMVRGALHHTDQADLAASVTGHLGPNAPDGFDGVVFTSLGRREGQRVRLIATERITLDAATRRPRQAEAAARVLDHVARWLEQQAE